MKLSALHVLPLICLALPAQAQDPAATARKALDLMLGEKYAELTPLFTDDMKKEWPTANLAKLGEQIKTYGAVQKVSDAQVTKSGANTIAVFPVQGANRSVNFRFIVNAQGKVAAMFLQPAAVEWQRPSYSRAALFKEREVTVGEGEWKLPGTLTVPNLPGPFPAVVLVHGARDADRDQTVGGAKIFKDLAEGLASAGILVLRYDKRTRVYGSRVAAMKQYTIGEEVVDDAVKAVALLRTLPEVNGKKIYVIGHSVGAYAAPRIADEDGKLAGLVLMAGNVRGLEDVVVDQLEYVGANAKTMATAKEVQAKVKKLEPGDADSPPLMNTPATYWLDLKGYDPAAKAKTLGIPILILQGERDYEVTMKEYALWKASVGSQKGVAMKSYPSLNHLFIAGEGKSLPAEYNKPGHVAADVINDIVGFVAQ